MKFTIENQKADKKHLNIYIYITAYGDIINCCKISLGGRLGLGGATSNNG